MAADHRPYIHKPHLLKVKLLFDELLYLPGCLFIISVAYDEKLARKVCILFARLHFIQQIFDHLSLALHFIDHVDFALPIESEHWFDV